MTDFDKKEEVEISEENIKEEIDHEIDSQEENEDELTKFQRELDEMKSLAQRTQADFINYKRRVEKEKADLIALSNEKIMLEMIEILDNFERALTSEKESNDTPFYKGVGMIFKQLQDSLGKFGLEEIEALDEEFDPNFHHAVMQEDGENPGCVMEVLQKGYKLKNKVIRPAMVKVCK